MSGGTALYLTPKLNSAEHVTTMAPLIRGGVLDCPGIPYLAVIFLDIHGDRD